MNYIYDENKTKEYHQESQNIDLKIMICDDDNLILKAERKLLETICKEYKKEVYIQSSSNGLECVYKIFDDYINKGLSYSILFIDENMPYMNGTEATSILKKLQSEKTINNFLVYSVTAHEDEETLKKILSYGCDGTVTKPLSKRVLINVLNNSNLLKTNYGNK